MAFDIMFFNNKFYTFAAVSFIHFFRCVVQESAAPASEKEPEVKISVKERTQKFNRMASEGELRPALHQSNKKKVDKVRNCLLWQINLIVFKFKIPISFLTGRNNLRKFAFSLH
jgi:hypothetical protein